MGRRLPLFKVLICDSEHALPILTMFPERQVCKYIQKSLRIILNHIKMK